MWRRGASSSAGRAVVAAALALAAAASCDDTARDEAARAAPPAAPAVTRAVPAPREPPAPRTDASDADSGDVAQPLVTLIPSDDPAITAALVAGLRLAFDEAAAAGGPSLELVLSTTTPKWGSAVESAVTDAVERGAVALVAPPERRHAHLLAQLGTKMRLPLLSTSPAHSVLAAGSPYVAAVVPTREGVRDEAPVAPDFDAASPAAAAFVAAFRAKNGRAPGPWDAVGYDAGRCAVEAVRAHGLHRRGLVETMETGVAVRGAAWDLVFGANGSCTRRAGGAK